MGIGCCWKGGRWWLSSYCGAMPSLVGGRLTLLRPRDPDVGESTLRGGGKMPVELGAQEAWDGEP